LEAKLAFNVSVFNNLGYVDFDSFHELSDIVLNGVVLTLECVAHVQSFY